MELTRFLQASQEFGWRGMALWAVLLAQAILWVGLVRLHLSLYRENAPWAECIGKIRSALLRSAHAEEELAELRVHRYAPLVDRLIAVHFAEQKSETFTRWLLLRWRAKDGLRPYWVRWGHLLIAFGIVVWFLYGLRLDIGFEPLRGTPCDPRLLWIWLGYAMFLAWQMVRLHGHLEHVQRALLLPRKEE